MPRQVIVVRLGVPEMQSADSSVTLAGMVRDSMTEFSYRAHPLMVVVPSCIV